MHCTANSHELVESCMRSVRMVFFFWNGVGGGEDKGGREERDVERKGVCTVLGV